MSLQLHFLFMYASICTQGLYIWDKHQRHPYKDYVNTIVNLGRALTQPPFAHSLFHAGLDERQWWSDLHRLMVSDIPTGISETDTPNKQRACINAKILHVLHELWQAQQLTDAHRVKALPEVLRHTARDVGSPFHVPGIVVAPNPSTVPKIVTTNILCRALRDNGPKAYQR